MKTRQIFKPVIRGVKQKASKVAAKESSYQPLDTILETKTMHAWAPLPFKIAAVESSEAEVQPKAVWSVVIIHQSAATKKRGHDFSKFLMRQLGEATLWTSDGWSMDELTIPDIHRAAIEAAAIADVVIISMDGGEELQDGTKAWLEAWGGRLFDRSPILIALFGAGSQRHAPVISTKEFLGTIADTCGLTFLHTSGANSIVEYRPPLVDCLGLLG